MVNTSNSTRAAPSRRPTPTPASRPHQKCAEWNGQWLPLLTESPWAIGGFLLGPNLFFSRKQMPFLLVASWVSACLWVWRTVQWPKWQLDNEAPEQNPTADPDGDRDHPWQETVEVQQGAHQHASGHTDATSGHDDESVPPIDPGAVIGLLSVCHILI